MAAQAVVDPVAQPTAVHLVVRARQLQELVAEIATAAAPLVEPSVWDSAEAAAFRAAWPGMVSGMKTGSTELLDAVQNALSSIRRTHAALEGLAGGPAG